MGATYQGQGCKNHTWLHFADFVHYVSTWFIGIHGFTKLTYWQNLLNKLHSNYSLQQAITSQNAAFTTVVEDQHNLPGHTPLHILFGEQICWSRLVGYQNGICLEEWDTNTFPSFLSWGSAKQQVAFADPQISRQHPLRSWKGSWRTAESYSLHI